MGLGSGIQFRTGFQGFGFGLSGFFGFHVCWASFGSRRVLTTTATLPPCDFSTRTYSGPQKDTSISILYGYPYLNGLHYKGVYMGDPWPYSCLCVFLC